MTLPDIDPTEAALLRGICAAPLDTLPRLVYADWLDEQHWPARVRRAAAGFTAHLRTGCHAPGNSGRHWWCKRVLGEVAGWAGLYPGGVLWLGALPDGLSFRITRLALSEPLLAVLSRAPVTQWMWWSADPVRAVRGPRPVWNWLTLTNEMTLPDWAFAAVRDREYALAGDARRDLSHVLLGRAREAAGLPPLEPPVLRRVPR